VLTAGGDQIFPRGLPVGTVEKVLRDPDRGSFIEVVIKPASDLQHLDEVLVITSLEPQLSPQQQADLTTSEELKGAEAAAEAERKKAAAEMAERLPGLKDPNAPVTPPVIGPDGQPVVPPPATPKPLPALHPDRFSPGGAADTPSHTDSGANNPATSGDGTETPRSATPKTQPKPQSAKPATPRSTPGTAPNSAPKAGPGTPQTGRVQ
jgi:rod shape-determining protein MreC